MRLLSWRDISAWLEARGYGRRARRTIFRWWAGIDHKGHRVRLESVSTPRGRLSSPAQLDAFFARLTEIDRRASLAALGAPVATVAAAPVATGRVRVAARVRGFRRSTDRLDASRLNGSGPDRAPRAARA
jgi:hypothetical protein